MLPLTASAVVDACVSWTIFQSHAVAEQWVFQPAWSSQMNSPPATQCVGLFTSALIGAMNCADGSHGFGVYVNASHDGLISR